MFLHTASLMISISEKACCQVSCSATACDWTTGRKRSHTNCNQLTDKWAAVSYLWQPMTSQSASSKATRVGVLRLYRTTNYSKSALAKRPVSHSRHYLAIVIESALQIKLRLNCCFHSLQFSAPCGRSNASQKMLHKEYTTSLCKP